jgi:NitT/TauT family transport system permease protein
MRVVIERVLVSALLLGLWQILPTIGLGDRFFISSPTAVVGLIGEWITSGELAAHIWVTVQEALLGLVIGSVLGAVFGLACGLNDAISRALLPLMTVSNALPRLAFAPLLIAWFGFGLS